MDERRIDAFAKAVARRRGATGAGLSRRGLLGVAGGVAALGLSGRFGRRAAAVAPAPRAASSVSYHWPGYFDTQAPDPRLVRDAFVKTAPDGQARWLVGSDWAARAPRVRRLSEGGHRGA